MLTANIIVYKNSFVKLVKTKFHETLYETLFSKTHEKITKNETWNLVKTTKYIKRCGKK